MQMLAGSLLHYSSSIDRTHIRRILILHEQCEHIYACGHVYVCGHI